MVTFKTFLNEAKYGGPRRVRRWVARYHLDTGEHHEIGFTARDKRDSLRVARSRMTYAPWRKNVKKVTTKSIGS